MFSWISPLLFVHIMVLCVVSVMSVHFILFTLFALYSAFLPFTLCNLTSKWTCDHIIVLLQHMLHALSRISSELFICGRQNNCRSSYTNIVRRAFILGGARVVQTFVDSPPPSGDTNISPNTCRTSRCNRVWSWNVNHQVVLSTVERSTLRYASVPPQQLAPEQFWHFYVLPAVTTRDRREPLKRIRILRRAFKEILNMRRREDDVAERGICGRARSRSCTFCSSGFRRRRTGRCRHTVSISVAKTAAVGRPEVSMCDEAWRSRFFVLRRWLWSINYRAHTSSVARPSRPPAGTAANDDSWHGRRYLDTDGRAPGRTRFVLS